jgi:iron(II)-dependent oxidoreductase
MAVAARPDLALELERARARTLELLAPLSDDDLTRQHSPLQSPLVWDLAHVGHFEELWLLRRVGGRAPLGDHDDLYDAFRHARSERGALPLLGPAQAFRYLADVRAAVLELLDGLELDDADPLLAGGFAIGLVVQHELQHRETMLQTLQLREAPLSPLPPAPAAPPPAGELRFAGGAAAIGGEHPWAYDNERPPHEVELAPFALDARPVTNAEWAELVEAGGVERPLFWRPDGTRVRFGHVEPIPPDEPVQHVSWHQADTFARRVGARLPTEHEWEAAARLAPEAFGGGVWEWTSSHFRGYPGFRAFPYREYSEVFFGDGYRVLRGGSWATDPLVARTSFRNWDLPQRRQIFAGLRLARDL